MENDANIPQTNGDSVTVELPKGFTYFVRDGELIKIGFTERPSRRLRQLKREFPDLELLSVVPGVVSGEFETHQRFDHLRSHGEWFRAEPELLDFIALLKVHSKPEFVWPTQPAKLRIIKAPKLVDQWGKLRGQLIMRRKDETDPRITNRIDILVSQIGAKKRGDGGPDLDICMHRTMTELAALSN